MDLGLERRIRSDYREIPLAPILDLLVIVIFFLLLSVSFGEYTKQTLPPATVSAISDPAALPPLTAKLVLLRDNASMNLWLVWQGTKPGQLFSRVNADEMSNSILITQRVEELAVQFHDQYPSEKSIQLGLSAQLPYQIMVAAMDGLQVHVPDVILMSSPDAESVALTRRSGGKDAGNP